MPDCIFCKIASGEIPSNVVYEDADCMVFHDLSPAAPTHVLVVPKRHYADLTEVEDSGLLGHLLTVAAQTAEKLGLKEDGFRIVINTGENGGQTVAHLHIHLLGGRSMAWPPG